MAQSGRLARLGGLLYIRLTTASASVESGGSKFSGAYGRRALSGPAPGGPQEAAKGAAAGAAAGGAAGAQAAQAAGETAAKRGGLNVFQWAILGGLGLGGAYTYTLFTSKLPQQPALGSSPSGPSAAAAAAAASKPGDYGSVRKAIAGLLDTEGYDDGSYGPLLVRLAWHASGTYCKATGTGGSHGATMRFAPECEWGANKGLHIARSLLEPLKAQFPWISYADLWTLAGVVAIEEMGGPVVPWHPGRSDHPDGSKIVPDGRLPDAAQGAQHIRDIFYRMGFDDRDIVALSGAHTLGRCHTDRSGFLGPWTNAPTTFSNLYFQELLNNKWTKKKWDGPLQYEDKTKTLMMLPTDMSLIWDKKFKKYVDQYAKDEEAFFKDFASAFSRLLELGVPFPAETAKAA